MKWYFAVLNKYAVLDGRASRTEYWMFLLGNIIIALVLAVIEGIAGIAPETDRSVLASLFALAIVIPYFAVAVRRMHDIGRSGWNLLFSLVPLIGTIIILIFTLSDSQNGDNKYGPNPKGVDGNMTQSTDSNAERGIAVLCEKCFQKMSIPKPNKKIRVRCPSCGHEFDYKYNVFGFSPSTKKYLGAGIVAGIAGTVLLEIVDISFASRIGSVFIYSPVTLSMYAACLGAVMGAAEGYFRNDRERLYYGLKTGIVFGLLSGLISGLIAQIVYSISLGAVPEPTLGRYMFARTLGWCTLGLLIGLSYGIKENTSGDLKFGLIGGAVGGAIAGILFDPIDVVIPVGASLVSRMVGFVVLGIAVCVSINRFQEVALRSDKPEMYQQLSTRLPTNPRLLSTGKAGPPPEIGSRWGGSQ